MKKLFLSFAILFAASTVLVSCGDDDKKDGSSDSTPNATAEAKADGGQQDQKGQQDQQDQKGQNPDNGTQASGGSAAPSMGMGGKAEVPVAVGNKSVCDCFQQMMDSGGEDESGCEIIIK